MLKNEFVRTEARTRRNGFAIVEATQTSDIEGYKRYAYELITGVLPNLVANEMVSVQALKQKNWTNLLH